MLQAHQLAKEIAAGKVSAREAVAACIERIESTHSKINAVVVPRFDEALKEADLADASRVRGDALGPLHGIPITIKESFDVMGMPTTAGLTNRANHRAVTDAWIVERLRQAGAIVLGKTNVSQLLLHDTCSNPLYGRTNNPWQLERSPGASSGGEAAVLAVEGSALGFGSDIGGSVRLPAHSCGVNSLKPTSGRLPLDGHISLFPLAETLMCQPGPLARSVADLALAMRVLAGIEPAGFRGLRIGFYTDNGIVKPSPAIRFAVRSAALALEQRGFIVQEWQPPDVYPMWNIDFGILLADRLAKVRQLSRGSRLSPNIRMMLPLGALPKSVFSIASRVLRMAGCRQEAERAAYSAEPYEQLLEQAGRLRRGFIASMDAARIDAIVCPVFPVPALRHRMSAFIDEGLTYTAVYNLLGMPAGVVAAARVRAGEETDRAWSFNLVERAAKQVEVGSVGLPVGVQVVARHWREDIVLGIMSALEEHFGPVGLPR